MATFFWKDFPDMDHMHFYVTYRKFPHQGLVGSSAPSCCIFQVYIPTNDCTHITTPTARAWQHAAKSRGLTRCHGPRPAGHAHFFIIFSHFVHHFRFAALGWGLLVSSALCGAGYFDPSAPHSHYIRNSSAFFWMLTNEPAAVNRGKIMLKPNDQWSLASWVFSCVGIFWHSNISAWYSWIQNFIRHSNLFESFLAAHFVLHFKRFQPCPCPATSPCPACSLPRPLCPSPCPQQSPLCPCAACASPCPPWPSAKLKAEVFCKLMIYMTLCCFILQHLRPQAFFFMIRAREYLGSNSDHIWSFQFELCVVHIPAHLELS